MSKRPPKKIIDGSVRRVGKSELPVFTAAGISKFNIAGNKYIKKVHAVFLPQILLHFSGAGAPMLDYSYYSAVPVIAVMMLLSHPIMVWIGSSKITSLSFDIAKKEVYVQSLTQVNHTIPLSQCSLTTKPHALVAGSAYFYFYNLGNFNERNLKVFKKTLESTSEKSSPRFNKLDRTKGLVSGNYVPYMMGSCIIILGLYFITGYSDLAYFVKLSGDVGEYFFGFNLFETRFSHLMLHK
jgi:hypothetical protein